MLEAALRRQRAIVLAGLVGVVALAWGYLGILAGAMDGMPAAVDAAMTGAAPWTGLDFALMFVMWAVMMVAMMVPGAAPAILLYARIAHAQRERGHILAPTGMFVAGYVVAWTIFSLFATLLQWAMDQSAMLPSTMAGVGPRLGGVLLILAGLYQFMPIKHACLRHCRAPLQFFSSRWRKGVGGALRMGLEHGAYCVGCCWFLMGLLFVAGVMNLLWVAAIAGFVLLEKVLPHGILFGRGAGGALAAAGVLLIILG